jgi:hypothetical protein
MINIASLYYFTLLDNLSPQYKRGLLQVLANIDTYLSEEWISVRKSKKHISWYELIVYQLDSVWSIHLFQKSSKEQEYYYYPSFFCDIYIDKKYLNNWESKKKIIFLLSNIFECFDEFDEKNLLIEFHRGIESSYNNQKDYQLRYDFININSLTEIYSKKDIESEISNFIKINKSTYTISWIKDNFPEVYRTLLFFVYNIFAMQKALISNHNQLTEIQTYEKESWENMHISLSEERLKLNQASLKKTLTLYQVNFENFINIMTLKD